MKFTPYTYTPPYKMSDTDTHLFNHWTFLIKTSLYDGLPPTPHVPRITMTEEQLANVESFIVYCVNRCMATKGFADNDTSMNEGLNLLEIATNKVLKEQHKKYGSPWIIVDMFASTGGIEVRVSMMAPKNSAVLGDGRKWIGDGNERHLLR